MFEVMKYNDHTNQTFINSNIFQEEPRYGINRESRTVGFMAHGRLLMYLLTVPRLATVSVIDFLLFLYQKIINMYQDFLGVLQF